MVDEAVGSTVWWHTSLHIVASVLLWVPAVFICGALTWLYDFLFLTRAGEIPNGGLILARAVQYGVASVASLFLPIYVLKRSNTVIITSVFGTLLVLLNALIILSMIYGDRNPTWMDWLETTASIFGSLAGVGYAYFNADEFRP